MNRDSGTLRGERMTGGGRGRVRPGSFIRVAVAARHNPVMRTFYRRLIVKGKTKMSAVVAVMRKILIFSM